MAEKYSSRDLQKWLFDKALEATAPKARQLIMRNDQRHRETTFVGRLYFFKYDPKYKDTLSQYDKFPMVFPIEIYNDGFLGLNLHYLGTRERQAILGRLLKFKSNEKMDKTTRLRLSYDLIMSTTRLNTLARPCVKRYLFTQVRSQFIEVYMDEFDKAIQLPVEDWVFKR